MYQKIIIAVVLLGIGWYVLQGTGSTPEVVDESVSEMSTDTASPREVTSEMVNYYADVSGYLAQPATPGDYPGVVMIHENRGLRPEIKQAADELAREGYRVLAVDLFNGVVMETQEEARAFSSSYNREEGLRNMQAAVTYMRGIGAPTIASLGWCFGGAESLALSLSGAPIDATVIYYGRLVTDEAVLQQLPAPVLGIFGDQDQVVPVASVTEFETALRNLNIAAEIHMYEGVGHAFANPSNPNFAPAETTDAWQKTLAFLRENL